MNTSSGIIRDPLGRRLPGGVVYEHPRDEEYDVKIINTLVLNKKPKSIKKIVSIFIVSIDFEVLIFVYPGFVHFSKILFSKHFFRK